jgi:6-pyruvoyltetrahydropterin/6-carboxytetrahydropterin synthase
MIYVTKRSTFSAAHRLWSPHLTDEENNAAYGKCANPNGHGHNYILEVTIGGWPDRRTGMVYGMAELKHTVDETIIKWVDHKHLNYDVPWLKGDIPTVEILLTHFWQRLEEVLPQGMLSTIQLAETENNHALYRREVSVPVISA